MTYKSTSLAVPLGGARQSPKRAIAVGERVRVKEGPLDGAYGSVLATKPNKRYVVAIDGLPRGIYVIVNGEAVVKIELPPK